MREREFDAPLVIDAGFGIDVRPADQWRLRKLDDFAQCILEGRPTKVPGEEGLQDVRILQAIYESARTGKVVALA